MQGTPAKDLFRAKWVESVRKLWELVDLIEWDGRSAAEATPEELVIIEECSKRLALIHKSITEVRAGDG